MTPPYGRSTCSACCALRLSQLERLSGSLRGALAAVGPTPVSETALPITTAEHANADPRFRLFVDCLAASPGPLVPED